MKMQLKHGDTVIELDENQQSEVYEFYRLHCTMERVTEIIEERGDKSEFVSDNALKTVAQRVLDLKDDNHVSEDEAIEVVLNDDEYMKNYLKF